MKSSIKGLFVILVIVMSFVAVQSVCAVVTGTVTATISQISITHPYKIVVDDIEVSGVRPNYLCNQYNICLEEGNSVTIDYYEFECSNGDIKLMAYSITVGDVTVDLRPLPE